MCALLPQLFVQEIRTGDSVKASEQCKWQLAHKNPPNMDGSEMPSLVILRVFRLLRLGGFRGVLTTKTTTNGGPELRFGWLQHHFGFTLGTKWGSIMGFDCNQNVAHTAAEAVGERFLRVDEWTPGTAQAEDNRSICVTKKRPRLP